MLTFARKSVIMLMSAAALLQLSTILLSFRYLSVQWAWLRRPEEIFFSRSFVLSGLICSTGSSLTSLMVVGDLLVLHYRSFLSKFLKGGINMGRNWCKHECVGLPDDSYTACGLTERNGIATGRCTYFSELGYPNGCKNYEPDEEDDTSEMLMQLTF
jgi:hypothetical protein